MDRIDRFLTEHGGKLSGISELDLTDKGVDMEINRLQSNHTACAFIIGVPIDAAKISGAAARRGLDIIFVGLSHLSQEELVNLHEDVGPNLILIGPPDPQKNTKITNIIRELSSGSRPISGNFSFYGYAAIQVWASAVKSAGATEPNKVAVALREQKEPINTVIGMVMFDSDGVVAPTSFSLISFRKGVPYPYKGGGNPNCPDPNCTKDDCCK